MQTINIFNQVFYTITTIGGVGIINYLIAEKVGALDRNDHNSETMTKLSLVFTMFDAILYLVIQTILNSCHLKGNSLIIAATILTIIVSVLTSLLLSNPVHKMFYLIINKVRGSNGKVEAESGSTWKDLYENAGKKPVYVYCYNFQHKPLGWGFLTTASTDLNTDFSLNLTPAKNKSGVKQVEYEELEKRLGTVDYKKNYIITQHINFKQQFIVVSLIEKD